MNHLVTLINYSVSAIKYSETTNYDLVSAVNDSVFFVMVIYKFCSWMSWKWSAKG